MRSLCRVVFVLCLSGLLALLGLAPGLAPGVAQAQPGGSLTSFPLLRLEPSARAAALGGSSAALADGDVHAFFYNPALPSAAAGRAVGLSYLNHVADVNAGSVAYTHPIRGLGTTAFGGVRFVHWGEFDGRDAFGVPTGTFRAGDVALTLGAARPFRANARYGVALHVLHSGIDTQRATAVAADAGVLYRLPARQLAVGASVRNLGAVLDGFAPGDDTTLPADVRVSVSKGLAHLPFLVTVSGYDLANLRDGVDGGSTVDHVLAHLTLGGEFQFGDVFRARLGYNHRRSQDLALNDRLDLAGLGAGFGVSVQRVTVDYAYNSWSDLGGLHHFTLTADV